MKYFKNTSWLFAEKILRMVVGLFVGIWVARYLGPEQFGLFSYAQSFVALFAGIATLGLDGIVIREFIKDKSKREEILSTAFILKLFGAFLVLIILLIAINFTKNDSYTNMLIFIIASSVIFQSFNVVDMYYQSQVMSKYVVYLNSFTLFIGSILKILFILNEATLINFAWVIVIENITLAIGFIYLYITTINNTLNINNLKLKKELASSLLRDSWPLILSGIVISVYMKIDQIMIQNMLGNEAAGQYSAATKITEIWYAIPVLIMGSIFPAIVNVKNNQTLYLNRLQKLYDIGFWVAILIALIVSLNADLIINLLYGIKYYNAASVLVIHFWTSVFVFLGVISGKWYLVENLQKYSFYRGFIGMIINIVLNYLLIPIYHIEGAAVATLISQLFSAYLFNAMQKKTRIVFCQQTKAILFPIRNLGVKLG